MIGQRVVLKRGNRDEAEKPFWISFADLMTALMVLFLVSLSVALVRAQDETAKAEQAQKRLEVAMDELKKRENDRDTRRERRDANIASCENELDHLIAEFNRAGTPDVRLDRSRHAIDFGTRALFEDNSHELTRQQASDLRAFTLGFIRLLTDKENICSSWFKRVIVEGFTDNRGSYLHNLNLSLNRSQRVMCVLLSGEYGSVIRQPQTGYAVSDRSPASVLAKRELPQLPDPIAPEDADKIRSLFLVGGYSSNSQKLSSAASRRIEMRIEFFQIDEDRAPLPVVQGDIGKCAIGGR